MSFTTHWAREHGTFQQHGHHVLAKELIAKGFEVRLNPIVSASITSLLLPQHKVVIEVVRDTSKVDEAAVKREISWQLMGVRILRYSRCAIKRNVKAVALNVIARLGDEAQRNLGSNNL